MSEENPSQSEIAESINKLAKKMEQKIIEDARLKVESGFAKEPVVLPFLGFPVEEVTELDWHRHEKEQLVIYKDLMDDVAAQEINDEIWQRARWEERRQMPIRQAEEYLASCSDEKDAESCTYWKEQREKLFEEQAERAKVLAEADAAYICKRDLPPLEARDAWMDEMGKSLSQFPQVDAEEWKDSWDGKISLEKHLDQTKHMSDMIDTQYQENKHLIITNRVLTILLIFSTAFGITAALAWLRCQ